MRVQLKAYREPEGVIDLALDAVDPVAARRQAEAQGYRVLSARNAEGWSAPGFLAGRGFSVPLFAQELLALLEAGLGLVETITLLAHKARQPEAQRILNEVQRRIGEGRTFSAALADVPDALG